MRISKIEFNKFWNEILGDDWYVDDDDFEFDDELDEVVLEDVVLAYQGNKDIKLPKYAKRPELDERFGRLTTGLKTLFRRWRKSQTHVTFIMHFTVEKDKENELREKLEALGGKIAS